MAVWRWIFPSAKRLAIVAGVMLVALMLYPVRNQITRTGIVASLVALDLGMLLLVMRRRLWLGILVAPQLLLGVFLVLPGQATDPAALSAAYVRSLERFEGTRYVWGGENHLGVDCSGLLRTAFVEAQALESMRTLNPELMRQAIWLWWHDASADEMSSGYRGRTFSIGKVVTLAKAGENMRPGDFAVTADGAHVLAYVGEGEWIEADPFVNRVIRIKPGEHSPWWETKVLPGRWRLLDSIQ